MLAVDYGADQKLRIHGADGVIPSPKNTRGFTPAQKFAETLQILLEQDDLAAESPTVGSSGAESEMIRDVVKSSEHILYVISARAVKNYAKDHELSRPDDAQCAAIIYEIATANPAALKIWQYLPKDQKLRRKHTSVRPYDKRNYKDPVVDKWLSLLPPFDILPPDMQELLGNGKKRTPGYAPARVLPFAMALDEEGAGSRKGYEHVIGLYGHGYPSYYRRKTVELMQRVAKEMTGAKKFETVTPEQRKQAWRITRSTLRRLHYLATGTTIPAKGTPYPSLFDDLRRAHPFPQRAPSIPRKNLRSGHERFRKGHRSSRSLILKGQA